jgi:1,4-alpha-glucan branching enzyme
MPGDDWHKFANLRLLYAYMWAQPGKKMLFMGCEFAQRAEWNHDSSLDWHLLGHAPHGQVQLLVGELNRLYRQERALHELDTEAAGFEWVEANDGDNSVYSFMRKSRNAEECILAVLNCTPVPRDNYRIGVDRDGYWREVFNSDADAFGGSGHGNGGGLHASPVPKHGRRFSLSMVVPPLGAVFFKAP